MKKINILCISIFVLSVVSAVIFTFFFRDDIDRIGPQIFMESDSIDAKINVSEEKLLEGVTAKDTKDGDVTESIVIENISKFWEPGKCTVNYAAFDSDGNVGKASRTLTYTDYKSPEFEIVQPLVFEYNYSGDYTEFIKVNDCIDGDITSLVKISQESRMDFYESNNNFLKYVVTNRFGDTVELPVNVVIDKYGYGNSLKLECEKYLVYTEKDTPVDIMSYVERAIVRGVEYSLDESLDGVTVRNRINLVGDVDYKTPGIYQVDIKLSYTIDDSLSEDENSYTVPFIIVVR